MAVQRKGKRARRARIDATAAGVAHQIWLAGLGALARAQAEGPKLFESLAAEGAVIQERGRAAAQAAVKGAVTNVREAVDTRVETVRGRANEAIDAVEKLIQTRVQRTLQQIGVPSAHEIHTLSRKVNELNRSVQVLTRSSRIRARTPSSRSRAAVGSVGQSAAV
jgi:poly(hydroxyalkanoate) granule-associated protein